MGINAFYLYNRSTKHATMEMEVALPMNVKRILLLVFVIVISFSAGVFANSGIEKVEAYLRGDYQVFLDGKKVDVGKVLVYQGSSYLPLVKVGSLLDADVAWNPDNKGIYVNPRFAGQPEQVGSGNPEYEQITMLQPAGYMAKYLGKDHPVLAVRSRDYKLYYRDKDVQRMGIDTSGLAKAEEQLTKELYLTEAEMAKVWKEKPTFKPVYEKLIIGEISEDRMKSIQSYIDGLPARHQLINGDDPYSQYYSYMIPQIIVIEALPDDEFNLIGYENYEINQYWLRLKKNHMDQWYQSDSKIKTLVNTMQY